MCIFYICQQDTPILNLIESRELFPLGDLNIILMNRLLKHCDFLDFY